MNTDKDELRIKVAELRGWECIGRSKEFGKVWWIPPGGDMPRATFNLPDYPNDLNACQEFEKWLRGLKSGDPTVWFRYVERLRETCNQFYGEDISATAEQRCRTFVKTMEGK